MLLSDLLWKKGFFNHRLLRFAKPKKGRGGNKGKLVEPQTVWYKDEVIGEFDTEDKFHEKEN